jgi:hypothetical protein
MIQQLYSRYIQKSNAFLFPLLGIKRHQFCRPSQTYVRFKGFFVPEDLKLFCMYPNPGESRWTLYQKYHLLPHRMVEHSTPTLEGDEMLYIFNLGEFETDVHHFLKGEYSKFSPRAKQLISDYYGLHTPEWAYIQTYLSPQNFYGEYAQALEVEEDVIRGGVELCPRYDEQKETLDVDLPEKFMQQWLTR